MDLADRRQSWFSSDSAPQEPRPHDQRLAKDSVFRHLFSRKPHRDAISNLNDWELDAIVSCGSHARTLGQIYSTNNELFRDKYRRLVHEVTLQHCAKIKGNGHTSLLLDG